MIKIQTFYRRASFSITYCIFWSNNNINFDTETIKPSLLFGVKVLNPPRIPVGNYMFKVNNRNTITRCEICSKLTIKAPEWYHAPCSGVFILNFEQVNAGWDKYKYDLAFPLLFIPQMFPISFYDMEAFAKFCYFK